MLEPISALDYVEANSRNGIPYQLCNTIGATEVSLLNGDRSRLSISAASVGDACWFIATKGSGYRIQTIESSAFTHTDHAVLAMVLRGQNSDNPMSALPSQGRLQLSKLAPGDVVQCEGQLDYVCAYIPCRWLHAYGLHSFPYGHSIDVGSGPGAVIGSTLMALTREVLGKRAGEQRIVGMLPHFARLALYAFQGAEPQLPDTDIQSQRRFTRVCNYLEIHFFEPTLAAASVAKACGVSVRQLFRDFQNCGCSFEDTLRSLRLTYAQSLLRECPDKTITQIAYDAGFTEPSVFGRLFRSAYGETPTQHRKHRWADQGHPPPPKSH